MKSNDAKPIVIDFCLKVVRNSMEHSERLRALEELRLFRDKSLLPELEEIARSDHAEDRNAVVLMAVVTAGASLASLASWRDSKSLGGSRKAAKPQSTGAGCDRVPMFAHV